MVSKRTAAVFVFIGFTACLVMCANAQDGKHLFILSGQSNMRQPLPKSFEEAVSKVFGKDNVVVVMHAHPSQPIRRWYKKWTPPEGMARDDKKNGTLYDALLSKVNRTIKGKQFATTTFIWMQGEADAGKGWGAVYEKSFLGVLDQLKADLKLKKINFVLGRINDNWLTSRGVKDGDLVRKIQQKLGEDHPNGDWVNTDDLNKGVNPWGIYEFTGGHFPNAAYRVLGQRFARKACELADPGLKLDDKWFSAVFCDSAEDIENHLAVGKKISGTGAGLAALVDGEFGSDQDARKGWVGFPASAKAAELVVDLGITQDVTAVGVNILFDRDAGALLPRQIRISVSSDGTNFRKAHGKGIDFFYGRKRREITAKLKPQPILVLLGLLKQEVRYVRVELDNPASSVLLDEIVVNPTLKRVK